MSNESSPASPARNQRSAGPQGHGLKQPSGGSPTEAAARSADRREEIAPAEAGVQTKKRAPYGSKSGRKGKPPALPDNPALPAFEPVPRKFRHDGWTPERQKAFIGALADTGCVSRAARYVNMSMEGAYYLRRQKGSDSFRRAWEAALDLGVQRLKDEVYERALEGQLKPVFQGGKLAGFQRVKSDRLLMFALRMNAKDEYGRRMAATYFDPDAERLHAGTGRSDGGDKARIIAPTPSGEGVGGGGHPSSSSAAVGQQGLPTPTKITETITGPALSRMRRDDINAAIVADFDPAALTLPEIEAMQAMLTHAAARHRAMVGSEADATRQRPPEHDTTAAFIANEGVGASGGDGQRPPHLRADGSARGWLSGGAGGGPGGVEPRRGRLEIARKRLAPKIAKQSTR